MQREPPRKGGGSGVFSPLSFEGKLEKEEEILDLMLTAHARGQLPPDTWDRLHKAAQRDERLSELAFAYESVSQGKRLKALSGAPVAEFLFQAARFFGDVFGDEFGAATYLERALVATPTHAPSFEKLDALLTKAKNYKRLAELCTEIAHHTPRAEELVLLRRAAELFEKAGGADDKLVELYQQILRLDPSDEASRNQLEARYLKANRVRDVARLLEQALSVDPPPTGRAARKLHARLLDLYANTLHEPERSIPHVEALLDDDPSHDEARRIAQKLVVIKGLAARAAAALAKACSQVGTPAEVNRFLTIELEHTRGPKRRDVLYRIGVLRQERMNDEKGAFESFEQAIALDATDDELRARYAQLAAKLGKWLDAAKTLMRVGPALKDPAQRAKVSAEMGQLLLEGGDAKRAKATFVAVLAAHDAGPEATLRAARALSAIYARENDHKALVEVLERIATTEPDPESARVADEELADLAAHLGDTARAIAAYKRLLPTSSRAKALAALAPLFEASGDAADLALILEERAKDAVNPADARKLAFRAAEVRTTKTNDPVAASAAWKRFVEKFGAARDVHGMWIPLLEAQRDYPELAQALRADAQLAPENERVEILVKLGNVLLARLKDAPGAIDAFRRALAIDPGDKTARGALEKLAAHGEQRAQAAAVLEPLYRAEGNTAALLRVLDARAQLVESVDERLAALDEASQLAASLDPGRAVDLAGRGLAEAAANGRPLAAWLDRIDRLPASAADPKKRAALLGAALGDRVVDTKDLALLARRTGEAHARAGDVASGLSAYRRALAFEPTSAELISLIDDLLRDQGSPRERIALYKDALERGADARRRRDLLHRIGRIEKSDLKDYPAAIATYATALDDDPDDADAHAALVELFTESAMWQELCDRLEARLARVSGDEARRTRAQLAEVAAEHGQTERAREQCDVLMGDEALAQDALEIVQRVADVLGDATLARAVLARRAATAEDAREQVRWLEQLGELDETRRGDLEGAATAWKQAARIAEASGDDDRARQLFGRVRQIAPRDAETAERLLVLSERAEQWDKLPPLFATLLEQEQDRGKKVELLLRLAEVLADRLGDAGEAAASAGRAFDLAPQEREVLHAFERYSVAAGTTAAFERAIEEALTHSARGEDELFERAEMRMARARVLAADASRQSDAAKAYRELLDDSNLDGPRQNAALAAFDALVARGGDARRDDRRWLFGWRADHASEPDRVTVLLAWAKTEEDDLHDTARALAIHRRVLTVDPENVDALAAASRLALALGDTEGALSALIARRDRSEGPARNALDLEIAGILLDRTSRFEQALASVKSVLESTPQDQTALALAGRLLAGPSTRANAIAMLEEACEHADDPDVRAQILTCLLDAPAGAGSDETRRAWYERVIELHQAQGKLELALSTVVRAANELPLVDALWDRAEELARAVKRPDEVATLYQQILARSLEQDRGLALGERAVAFYEEWFEDSGRVVGILERVLEIDPTAQWAFDRLKLLFDAAERWDDLFALFERALPAATGATKMELLEEAAQVAKDFADRPDRAIGYLEQLLAMKPNDARLSASLERLYERQSRHRELVALLAARIPAQSPRDAQKTRARIAQLYIDELHDPASALGEIEEMMTAHQALANGEAIDVSALLEKVLAAAPHGVEPRDSEAPRSRRGASGRASAPPGPPKRASVRQRAAAILKERYGETGRDGDLVRMLEIELEAVKSIKERIRRHQQIAQLYANLGNDMAALEQYVALVTLEPDVAAHRVRLSELAEKVDRFDRLADVLASAADDCTDDVLRVELLMQAGIVQADRIGDGDRAIDLFARILSMEGVAAPAALSAARRLEPLLEAARRPNERLYVLERIAKLEPDAALRKQALGDAARLATELEEHDRAIAAWDGRLAEDAEDVEALDGLVSLLEKEQRWPALAEALEKRARAPLSTERRRADRVRIAELFSRELGDAEGAIRAWRDVEREFGESDESTRALAMLLRARSRWSELADLLARGASRAEAREARAEYLRQLGDVQKEQLGDPAAAVKSYAGALEADVHNAAARAGLHGMLGDDARRAEVVAVLMRAYEETDAWQLILELTAHRILAAEGDAEKLAVLLHAAKLAEERAHDAGLAFEAMRRAFLLAPSDANVEAEAVRLADATGAWRSLADAFAEAIAAEERSAEKRPSLASHLYFEMARILEDRLDDPRGALNAYLRIVSDEPAASVEAAKASVRVAGALGRWDAAAKVVVDVARARATAEPELLVAVEDAAARGGAWDALTSTLAAFVSESDLPASVARDLEAQLAAWHRDRRGDPDAAEAAFARALAHDPLNAELLTALAQLQRRAKGRPLVDSLLRLSQATGGDLDLLREAAEIAQQSIGDRALTKTILERLIALGTARWIGGDADAPLTMGNPVAPAPLIEWALGELVRVHEEEGEHGRSVDALAQAARLPFPREVGRAMRHRAARIAHEKLGDASRAIALYDALFEEDKDDAEAVDRLVSLYRAAGRTAPLLALRERQIAAAKTPPRRIALRLDAARLHLDLGAQDRALAVLEENLAEAPRDLETVEALTAIYETDRPRELVQLLSVQAGLAEAAGEGSTAAELWSRAATAAEEKLGDRAAATTLHERVVALEPRASSFDALARLARARGDHASAARFLAMLRDVTPPEGRAAVTLRLADALVASGQDDAAEARLEEACEADPAAEDLRARLSSLYRQRQKWRALAHLMTVASSHAPDKAARLARLREAAVLLTTKCGTPEEAIPLLEQASDLEPGEQSIRLALAGALGAAKRFDEARTLLRGLVDGFGGRRPKERAPVHYHLAQLELAMGNRARALVELDAATRIDPANPDILRTLAELARDDGQLERAERSYRALLVVLRRQEEVEREHPTSIARSEVLLELSSIAARQGQEERAKEILESALEMATRSELEEERLQEALAARGDYETLVRALEAKLARIGDGPDAAKPLSLLASVLEEKLARPAHALPLRLRVLALQPADDAAHAGALALARRTDDGIDRYEGAVRALATRAEQAGDAELACALLLRLGGVLESDVKDDARAAAMYERALELRHREADVLRALDRVYERLGDVGAQDRVLSKRIEIEGDAASDALYRLAALRLAHESTIEQGCDLLSVAIEKDPELDRAEAALRRAVEVAPRHLRVLELYERVGRAPGHERALVDALTRRAELPGASGHELREAVEVATGLGDAKLAESLLERFIDGERTATQNVENLAWALATLAEIREKAGDLRQAVELKKAAADLAEPETSRRLSFEVAKIAEGPLADLALAALTYEALRAKDPADREAWEPLLDVYRRMNDARRLAELLASVVEYVDDIAERSKLRLERVRVMMKDLGLGDEAEAPLREIVDDDPSQVEAAMMLANILERRGAEDDLAELLAKQMEAAKDRSDAASVASLALRLGALLEKRDRVAARNVYYAGLDWEPQSHGILRALLRLFEDGGEAADRADVMERLLSLESGPAAEDLALALHQLRVDQWDDLGAERALELGFKAHPASFVLKQRLETAYRERKAWLKLADLCVIDAGAQRSVDDRVARLREAARIHQTELRDPRAAAIVLRKARDAKPDDHAILGELVAMLSEAGDRAAAVEELTKAMEALDGKDRRRAGLLAERASQRSALGEEAAALEDLERAFSLDPDRWVQKLAAQLDRAEQAAQAAGDVRRARELRLRLVEILPQAGDAERARAILVDLVKHDPKDREALRALAAVEEAGGKWDAASAAYRRLVALEEGHAVVEIALRLADACERANRVADARGGLERARLVAPGDEALRKRLEQLYEQTGAYRELAEMYLADARGSGDVAGRFALLVRAGSLLLHEVADPEAAIPPLQEAQALRPSEHEGIVLLADALTVAGRTVEAADLLDAAIASHKGRRSRELASLYHRLARVAHADGEQQSELAWLTQSMDMDSQSGPVASELAQLAMDLGQLDLANRALRIVTMLKNPGPMSKALAYQYMGEIARKQGDTKRAVMLLKRAVQEDASLTGARALLDHLLRE